MSSGALRSVGTVALAASSFLVSLLVCEMAVRWVIANREDWTPPPPTIIDPEAPNPYVRTDREFLYFHLPGAEYIQGVSGRQVRYRINRRGFRGPDPEATPGMRRLLVIGDSMVEGHGVAEEETFPRLLDVALAPRGWQVVNAGVQGASPIYYFANVKRYLALDPDAVLVLLYDNDLAGDSLGEDDVAALPRSITAAAHLGVAPQPRSFLIALLLRSLQESPTGRLAAAHRDFERRSPPPRPLERRYRRSAALVHPGRFEMRWKFTSDYLEGLATELSAAHVELLLSTLSVEFHWPEDPSQLLIREQAQAFGDRVEAWSTDHGLPLLRLDLELAELFQRGEIPALLLPDDGHFSAIGHRHVARQIEPWLMQHLPRDAGSRHAGAPTSR